MTAAPQSRPRLNALSPQCEALPRVRPLRRIRAASGEPAQDNQWTAVGHGHSPSPDLWPPASLEGVTVVVVDDDDSSLDYFAVALRASGATVMTAPNAGDALRLVREHSPDVVLSDLAMDGRDGYWLIDAIRNVPDERVSRVPVVATTAFGAEHPRARTSAAGFVEHLRKPVDPIILCRTIARVAGR